MTKSIILTLTLAAASFAQAPSIAEITAYLTLNPTQVSQLQEIQTKLMTSTQSTAQSIDTKQQALQTALQKGGSSAATLGQMLLDIETLRKQLTDARTAANTSALLVLNADQKTKVKALDAASQLAPDIHEAVMLNLLLPPANAPGPRGPGGFGPQSRRGPQPPPAL